MATLNPRSSSRCVAVLLVLAAASVAPAAAAGYVPKRLTDVDLEKAIPVLRAQIEGGAALSAEAEELERANAAAVERREASREAIRSGESDPLELLRSRGIEALVPPGFKYHPRCSRAISESDHLEVVLVTGAPEREAVCGDGAFSGHVPPMQDHPQYAKALKFFESKGFVRDRSRGTLRHPTKQLGVESELHMDERLWRCVLQERAAAECGALPEGPILVLEDVTLDLQADQQIAALNESHGARQQAVADRQAKAGVSDSEWEPLLGALLMARADLEHRALMPVLAQAAKSDDQRRALQVRTANMELYERSKHRVALDELLQGRLPK